LIGLGVALLAVNGFGLRLPFDIGSIGWPALVIVPGVILLVAGLLTSGDGGQGLAVAGGVVSTIGLLLAYQVATDHWASWAYAWALVAPTSVGVALTLWGALHGHSSVAADGVTTAGIGLVLFIVGFALFEGVLHIGDGLGLVPLGLQMLPVALIVAGALIIVGRAWTESRKTQPPPGQWRPSYPPPESPYGQPTYPAAYPSAQQQAFPPPIYQPAPPPQPPPPSYQPTPLPPELDPRVRPEPNPWQLPDEQAISKQSPASPARVNSDEETTETKV